MTKFAFLTTCVLLALAQFVCYGQAQMVKQCLCSEIEPCKQSYMNALMPCLDSCQHHLASLGGNYQQLRQCFTQKQGLLQAAISCTQGQHANACARAPGQQVPKRYPETLEIAAMAEINKMINKMGLGKEAQGFLGAGKKMFGCVKACMAKKSGNCEKNLKCGLALPPDNVLVQSAKQCAINSGFNTASAQQLCQCAASAGVKGIGNMCSRIVIS